VFHDLFVLWQPFFLWHVSVVEFKKYLKYLKLILVKALRQMIL